MTCFEKWPLFEYATITLVFEGKLFNNDKIQLIHYFMQNYNVIFTFSCIFNNHTHTILAESLNVYEVRRDGARLAFSFSE